MFTIRLPIPFVNRFFTLWIKKSSSLHDCLYVYSFLKSDFRQLTVGVPKSLFTITKDVLLITFATALYLEDTYYQYLWTYIDLFKPGPLNLILTKLPIETLEKNTLVLIVPNTNAGKTFFVEMVKPGFCSQTQRLELHSKLK